MNALSVRDVQIDALESAIVAQCPPVDCPVVHYFAPGLYARELTIPQGTVLTGKIHKYANLSIMSKGRLMLYMEDGTTKEVAAPFTYVAEPGTRRAAFAMEETVWTVVHATDSTDLSEIEAQCIAQSPREYLEFKESQMAIEVQS